MRTDSYNGLWSVAPATAAVSQRNPSWHSQRIFQTIFQRLSRQFAKNTLENSPILELTKVPKFRFEKNISDINPKTELSEV